MIVGLDERFRTFDLTLPKRALYHLSYTQNSRSRLRNFFHDGRIVNLKTPVVNFSGADSGSRTQLNAAWKAGVPPWAYPQIGSVVFFTLSLRTAVSTTRTRSAWLRGTKSHRRPDGYEPTALLLSYPAEFGRLRLRLRHFVTDVSSTAGYLSCALSAFVSFYQHDWTLLL